jgi:heat shock protein HtpX
VSYAEDVDAGEQDNDADDGDHGGPDARSMVRTALPTPTAASAMQIAMSRSREFEAHRTGAELTRSSMPPAIPLGKREATAKRVPMNITPAQARHFIPTRCRGDRSASKTVRTHPTTK